MFKIDRSKRSGKRKCRRGDSQGDQGVPVCEVIGC